MRAAFNALSRVLPIAISAILHDALLENEELTPTVIFGAAAYSGVAVISPNDEISAAKPVAKASFAAASAVAKPYGKMTAASEAARAAAHAAAAAFYLSSRTETVSGAVPIAARAADFAKDLKVDFWQLVRRDLLGSGNLWPDGVPEVIQSLWAEAVATMEERPSDWSIWIHWYNRILQDRDWHPEAMGVVLAMIYKDDWEKGPEHINPMFDEVLELYLAEDAAQASPVVEPTIGTPSQIAQTKIAMETYRRELPGNFDAILGLISLETDRLQRRNYRNEDDRDEAKRQINLLATLHEAISTLATLVPKTSDMPEEDVTEAESLARLYVNKFKEWPRANAEELVDNTYRFALVGLTAVMLPMVGVSATVAAGCGAAFFAGERVLKSAKAAKDLLN